jgi:hypothetical protein
MVGSQPEVERSLHDVEQSRSPPSEDKHPSPQESPFYASVGEIISSLGSMPRATIVLVCQ